MRPAVNALYAIDSKRTVDLLLAHNDYTLQSFDFHLLFSVLGYETVTRFDNIFYFLMHQDSPDPAGARFHSVVYAEHYLATGEKKYLKVIGSTGDPSEDAVLYRYLHERGVPTEKIVYEMMKRGGLPAFNRTFNEQLHVSDTYTLEELLYQAALYRLGKSDTVYKKRFSIPDATGLKTERTALRDLADYGFSPYLTTCDALVHFFAGVPGREHGETVLRHWDGFEKLIRYRFVRVLGESPATGERERVLLKLLESDDVNVRRLAAEAFRRRERGTVPEELIARLGRERDPYVKMMLITASGQYLRIYRGGK